MPKRITDSHSLAFGKRLVELLEASGQPRRGAGAYLAKRYGVSTVTANAWLNGEYKPNTGTAHRIANDHGSSFDALYFGTDATSLPSSRPPDPSELELAVGLLAKALAVSIPHAADEFVSELEDRAGPFPRGSFLWSLVESVRSELPDHHVVRHVRRGAQGVRAKSHR